MSRSYRIDSLCWRKLLAFKTSDFDYPLDPALIAQSPLERRDRSRLMVLRRLGWAVEHRRFDELPQILRAGDLLVLNDTRVIPAKFFCRRASSGRLEGLFLSEPQAGRWEVLLKGAARCKPGESLALEGANHTLCLRTNNGGGNWLIDVSPASPAHEILQQAGTMPLPPYIRRDGKSSPADRECYQTVYASRSGAVAAPTAGLHFTPELLDRLAAGDIKTTRVTLHVGLGTFLPVKADSLEDHQMHSEWYELSAAAAADINAARQAGRRIVAVGTTAVRVLETVAGAQGLTLESGEFAPASGWTDIFIHPP
ncbi:MAG: tRNA preQ1(34) S-adenosylmethionine ribosyltransferase-isomerase QueA, partial [Planctomycetaceae bacterium]